MEGQEDAGLPNDFGAVGTKHGENGAVGHMTAAGSCKGTVERNAVAGSIGMTLMIALGRIARSHRMAAARTIADSV